MTVTAPSSNFTDFTLQLLRVASARLRLLTIEVDSVGTALAGNLIDADTAVTWATELGVLVSSATVSAST